jgi:hypothetical protein
MAVGLSSAAALALLTSLKTYDRVQLHIGDPGPAGTALVADDTRRVQVTWTATVTSQPMSNTNPLTWTAVTVTGGGTQDYTHFSAWTQAGAFGFSGTITANPVSNGDQFEIPIGDLDVSLPTAG